LARKSVSGAGYLTFEVLLEWSDAFSHVDGLSLPPLIGMGCKTLEAVPLMLLAVKGSHVAHLWIEIHASINMAAMTEEHG
jgi:hypothetical protein